MINFAVYDTATGQIVSTGTTQPAILADQAAAGQAAIEGEFDPDTQYFLGGVATTRPALPAVTATAQGFGFASTPPVGTTAQIVSAMYPDPVAITGQDVQLATPVAARIEIAGPFPYQAATIELAGQTSAAPVGAQIISGTMSSDQAHAHIAAVLDAFALGLTGVVARNEQLSYSAKEAAARAQLADSATAEQTALLTAEAAQTGETLDDLSTAIIAKADAFRAAAGYIAGIRRKYSEQIEAASDAGAIGVIVAAFDAEIAAL